MVEAVVHMTKPDALTILYKCKCMATEAEVTVPHRKPNESIDAWMIGCVQSSIYLDHRRRSPSCAAVEMEYAKVPAPESAPFIGGKPELN